MDVSINLIAVLLAAASTMVVGSIWYSPKGFYKQWSKLAKVKPDPTFNGAKMTALLGSAFLLSVVSAWVLAYFTELHNLTQGGSYLGSALMAGLVGWLGFTASRIAMHDSFERRPRQLTALTALHEFVTFAVMAVIIGLLG